MEQILKNIKKELQTIKKENNLKYSHSNNRYQEILKYSAFFALNRKKHYLEFRFILQKKEESLSFVYNYVFNSKTMMINETHSIANYQNDTLPGICADDKTTIKDIYVFEVVDGRIKNVVNMEKQYDVVMTIFKKNYEQILKHAKNIIKTKKIPE